MSGKTWGRHTLPFDWVQWLVPSTTTGTTTAAVTQLGNVEDRNVIHDTNSHALFKGEPAALLHPK
jgi:hypothetical protein